MKYRYEIIQELINVNGFKSYLELGCYKNVTFNNIVCEKKVGVDNELGGTHQMSTDEFFVQNNEEFDIVFIDADHHHDSVMRDFENALKILAPHGVIVLHDCNPVDLFHEGVGGCGTAWRALVNLRQRDDLDIIVTAYDHGTSIVRRGKNNHKLIIDKSMNELSYSDLMKNRDIWLNPQNWNDVVMWINHKPPNMT